MPQLAQPVFSSGFSKRRLAAIGDRIQADIDTGRIPGAAMLIARHGVTAYEAALGWQDAAAGAQMALDSIFRIYSMTKPIVSVAIMMLVEEGRLLISDPVARYLPELSNLQVGVASRDAVGRAALALEPVRKAITVQDLLRHTSGLTYGIFGDSLVKAAYREARVGSAKASSDEFIGALAQVPLAYQPGTTWEYSHSTDVLGVLVERIAGMTLDAFLDERIFKPLCMPDTGFWVAQQHEHRVAQAFAIDPVTSAPVKLLEPTQRPAFLSGGGGLMSTLHDYTRFAQMLLNGGELDGERIIARKTLQLMTSDHLAELPGAKTGAEYLPGAGYGFGLGFAVRTASGAAVMPGGVGDFTWSGLAGTYFWVDPQEQLLAVFMMQAPEQRSHYRQLFRNLVYAALE